MDALRGLLIIPQNKCMIHNWEGSGVLSNNLAECKALRKDLKLLTERNVWKVKVLGDSNLIVNLAQGRWQSNSYSLEPILREIKETLNHFEVWEINFLRRRCNVWADDLAKKGSVEILTSCHLKTIKKANQI
eukprot:Gb_21858 [translate_table: standard]